MKKFACLFALIILISGFSVQAATQDLGIKANSIQLSKNSDNLVAGQTVRVYASVFNVGNVDGLGSVFFYLNNEKISEVPVSARLGGYEEEVFADFVVPNNEFKIYVELKSLNEDSNSSNNQVLSPTFHVQKDSDGDTMGDYQDTDDDNDGVLDETEKSNGTNQYAADTDLDGVSDLSDQFPLDAAKSFVPVPAPATPPAKILPTPKPKPISAPASPAKTTTPTSTIEKKVQPALLTANTAETSESPLPPATVWPEFYKSPELELLNEVKIIVNQVNWNTFYYSFTTNLTGVSPDQLKFSWSFGDGQEAAVTGNHRYKSSGDYYVTLKVAGPLGNYLFDSSLVRVKFWSVYNYWLWLILLAVIMVVFLFSSGLRHSDYREKK